MKNKINKLLLTLIATSALITSSNVMAKPQQTFLNVLLLLVASLPQLIAGLFSYGTAGGKLSKNTKQWSAGLFYKYSI